jgi:hypothetical protein
LHAGARQRVAPRLNALAPRTDHSLTSYVLARADRSFDEAARGPHSPKEKAMDRTRRFLLSSPLNIAIVLEFVKYSHEGGIGWLT